MRRLCCAVACWLAMGTVGVVSAADTDDVLAVAEEAGVDPVSLLGAVLTTQMEPRAYLQMTGELAPPPPPLNARVECIIHVESRGDPHAVNPRSGASGLGQFLHGTWLTTPQGKAGYSVFDPAANRAAVGWMLDVGRAREFVAVSGGWC